MNRIYRLFFYLVYFFQAETKELRLEAFEASKRYYRKRPVRSESNPYPHPIEYSRRIQDTQAYQRAYVNTKCHEAAMAKIDQKYPR